MMPFEVHLADRRILLDERAALFDRPAGDWQIDGGPFGITIQGWRPRAARRQYLKQLSELTAVLMAGAARAARGVTTT